MSSFLKNVIKETGNEYGTIVSDGLATADVSGYVDTGSFIFNALCSGSIHGGLPQIKLLPSPESQQQEKHSSS